MGWKKRALFVIREARDDDFHKTTKHSTLWNEIAEELCGHGIVVDGIQCGNKWKSLKREFTKTLDHNNKGGNDKKTCKLYDDFMGIYGRKASSQAQCTISSLPSNDSDENTCTPAKKMRKERSATVSSIMGWLNEYREEPKKYRGEQRILGNRMTNKNMDRKLTT